MVLMGKIMASVMGIAGADTASVKYLADTCQSGVGQLCTSGVFYYLKMEWQSRISPQKFDLIQIAFAPRGGLAVHLFAFC